MANIAGYNNDGYGGDDDDDEVGLDMKRRRINRIPIGKSEDDTSKKKLLCTHIINQVKFYLCCKNFIDTFFEV